MRAMRKKRASRLLSVIFHHDNAQSHRAATTQTAVRQLGFELLSHPPYSPDLSPCDFFLFPVMKTYLRGTHFDDTHELSAAVQCRWLYPTYSQLHLDGVLSSHG